MPSLAPRMEIKSLLSEKRPLILKKWSDIVMSSYPVDTAAFLKKQTNQFINPVGHTIAETLEGIFSRILEGAEPAKISALLDNIIRLRAVQDFSPSQALSFIPALKKVLRDALKKELSEQALSEELQALESFIDDLALAAFDIYMKCREKIYELKATEHKNLNFRLLQKANSICEAQEQVPASEHTEKAF